MSQHKPTIAVIIVTFNSEHVICECLESIINCGQEGLQIVVVDNNSQDNTINIVKERFPQVSIIKLEKNIGYGAAVNRGVSSTEADYIVVSNPDIIFPKNFFKEMFNCLESHKELIILNPGIVNKSGEFCIPYRRDFLIMLIGYIPNKWFRQHLAKKAAQLYSKGDLIDISIAHGCCFMMKRAQFLKLGGFDENIFWGNEDQELSLRARKYGKIGMFTKVRALHHSGESSSGNLKDFKHRADIESIFYYYRKHQRFPFAFAMFCLFCLLIFFQILWRFIKMLPEIGSPEFHNSFNEFLKRIKRFAVVFSGACRGYRKNPKRV